MRVKRLLVGGPRDGARLDVAPGLAVLEVPNEGKAIAFSETKTAQLFKTSTYVQESIGVHGARFTFYRHKDLTPIETVGLLFENYRKEKTP